MIEGTHDPKYAHTAQWLLPPRTVAKKLDFLNHKNRVEDVVKTLKNGPAPVNFRSRIDKAVFRGRNNELATFKKHTDWKLKPRGELMVLAHNNSKYFDALFVRLWKGTLKSKLIPPQYIGSYRMYMYMLGCGHTLFVVLPGTVYVRFLSD